jgi:uncharacterized protein (TIGR02145 family)
VKSLLGEGGMGIVYLAEHVKLGRKVAIKVLHAHLASNESIRTRFMNEAKTMAELQHPNIVNLHDYHEDEFGLYLIMEYVDGKPLDEYIEQVSGPIPEEKAIQFFKQALSAFQYAHEKNVVHRDIKPSNLIITNEGKLKVLDFGIAKIVGNENYKLTKTGAHTGSVYYMSPEQVRGFDVDYRSDIYSLGITLYQMLTGYNPYVDLTTEYDIFEQIVKVPLPDPRTNYPAVSEHMVQVINKATQKNPLDRFNSCNDFSKSVDNKNANELSSVTKISEEEKTINVYDETLINNKISPSLLDLTKTKVETEPTDFPETKKKPNALAIISIAIILFIGLGWYLNNQEDKSRKEKLANSFETVTISNQDWMTKNLDVSTYRNGDEIPQVIDPMEWSNLTTGAWCYYENKSENGVTYGKLYNWYAVNDPRGLAPVGYHIPSKEEWTTLIVNLGGKSKAGGKMKEAGSVHWESPNEGANNKSGFGGLPGGYRNSDAFYFIGNAGYCWSSTDKSETEAYTYYLVCNDNHVYRGNNNKGSGFSVRCKKD